SHGLVDDDLASRQQDGAWAWLARLEHLPDVLDRLHHRQPGDEHPARRRRGMAWLVHQRGNREATGTIPDHDRPWGAEADRRVPAAALLPGGAVSLDRAVPPARGLAEHGDGRAGNAPALLLEHREEGLVPVVNRDSLKGKVQTVCGTIAPDRLGNTL